MHNPAMGFGYLAFLLYLLVTSIGLGTAQQCIDIGNFTGNSLYGRNRDLILSSLASNVTAEGGFYTATLGQEPDKVHALALCREGYDAEACSSCVNTSVHDLIAQCPTQKEAFSWGGDVPCLVRYANRSFLGLVELSPSFPYYNTGNISRITSNITQFDQIWESLMDSVVRKASMGSSQLKYASGTAELSLFQKIYTLMQCSPDLSQGDCDYCLRNSVGSYQSCCHGYQGGGVTRPSCFFRWDLYPFYGAFSDAPTPRPSPSLPSPPPPSPQKSANTTVPEGNGGLSSRTIVIIVVPIIIVIVLVALTYFLLCRRKTYEKAPFVDEAISMDSLRFDFETIRTATNNFSDENVLGQGGFGSVYKGLLLDGRQIAVKRLARSSGQGETEFKNEILLVARLQHKNLVKLLGFCLEGSERLLLYEFLPNSSLDHFIFHPTKRLLLNWDIRYKIIGGIARGLLYLHEDSQLRIIHRDLKASNILLDADMMPKISDFGMARLFEMDETQANTSRIVGTYGYMAPEYVTHGRFSVKSDVYSFGVLVLEIISGQKNYDFKNEEEPEVLLSYAWNRWNEGTAINLIDPILRDGSRSEMMRCIHIGLLCVQENVARRPTMASVVLMLTSNSISLAVPSKPAFFISSDVKAGTSSSLQSNPHNSSQSTSENAQVSLNDVSITELDPR